MLSDLRDSGSIEQDASKVLFVYRAEYYGLDFDEFGQDTKGRAEVKIAKNKFGDLKDVPLTFLGKYSKFVEIDKANFDYTNLRQNEFDGEPF
jgi:replicative DNA helicase